MRTIGVVIRTLNESELIGDCLKTLAQQQGGFDLDVLVVDSGSTDATIEIASDLGARVTQLPPEQFNYSKALNLGIEQLRGDLVVSLSAHAIPVDDQWLKRMAAVFDDPKVAGASSRQVPWPNAPWQEVKRMRLAFGEARFVYSHGNGNEITFSNAASMIRRSVWSEEPFTLPAVEDLEWAERVVAAGWVVLYEPRAAVYHSHQESPRAQARRLIDINRVADAAPGAPRRTRLRTLREAGGLFFRDSRWILGLEKPRNAKVRHLAELFTTVGYYVVDFSRSGTTAERRREDSDRGSNAEAGHPV